MVRITNITDKFLHRRLHNGEGLGWNPGETREVDDEFLVEQLKGCLLYTSPSPRD